jgi:hypothetical protein
LNVGKELQHDYVTCPAKRIKTILGFRVFVISCPRTRSFFRLHTNSSASDR